MPAMSYLLVTGDIAEDLYALSPPDDETHLLRPVAEWLTEALTTPVAVSYGIYRDRTAAGLISMIDPRLIDQKERDHFQQDALYVWRLMVDKGARRSGVGRKAIAFAEDYARLIGLTGLSLTTADKMPRNALPFYERLGFLPTGRRLNDEIELLKRF